MSTHDLDLSHLTSVDQSDREPFAVGSNNALRAPQRIKPSSPGEMYFVGGLNSAFPDSGTVNTDAPLSKTPALTRSHPFPLGEGTGERVKTEHGSASERAVPASGNGSGTGTTTDQESLPTPTTSDSPTDSTRLPFTVNHPTSPSLSSVLTGSTAQPASSWLPQQMSDIVSGLVSGTLDRPRPTVGRLADGSHCLYRGAVNGLAGESGSGKTWTALACARAELEDGHNVVYIDLEDSAVGIASRLLDLGVPADVIADPGRFSYVRPDEAFRDDVRASFWMLLDLHEPSLVVLDSTGESMALEGTDPNSDDAVARWFKSFASPISNRGPAVLLLDHLPKSDSAATSPIGSQRKRAAISGAQFIQTVGKGMSFAKGRAGAARLTCTKDRHGNFTTGEVVMELIVKPEPSRGESGVVVSLGPIDSDEWAPTRHMLDISDFLEAAGAAQSTSAIKKGVKGKAETLITALQVLEGSGYIVASAGARNATEYTSIKPYSLGDPYVVPDESAAGSSAGCEHEWHHGACDPKWCHEGHFGGCNEG